MIKYFLQISAMLGDILILLVSSYVIYEAHDDLFVWLIVGFAFYTWNKQGGFFAWKPKNIRQFFYNARKMGL